MNEGTCEKRVKIKRTSWHFKLYTVYFGEGPKDLCDYMWKLFFGIFLFGPLIIVVYLIAHLFALIARMTQWFFGFQQKRWFAFPFEGSVLSYKTGLYGGKESWKKNKIAPWEVVSPIFIILLFLYAPAVTVKFLEIGLVVFLAASLAVGFIFLFGDDTSILRRYVRAKKEKHCPLVELVDEVDE